jgi:hypothetical protein
MIYGTTVGKPGVQTNLIDMFNKLLCLDLYECFSLHKFFFDTQKNY